jgi:hypothetical protein
MNLKTRTAMRRERLMEGSLNMEKSTDAYERTLMKMWKMKSKRRNIYLRCFTF